MAARATLRPVVKALLAALATALVLVAGDAHGSVAATQDVAIPMDDGVSIAATLYLPDGTPPPGGWPAIVFLHGLSGNRQQMNALVEGYGVTSQGYAVLTFDARGHGESGGLVGIDGPREVADTREVFDWLAARPDVSDTKIRRRRPRLRGSAPSPRASTTAASPRTGLRRGRDGAG